MTLERELTLRYVRRMIATPAGRAHLLNQIAEAEDSGEARVFTDLLAVVDDPKLKKMIERHQADELRHGRLFHAELAKTGVDPGPVPAELKVLERLDRALGGFFEAPITDARGVMMAYLILQVIEERALDQFAIYREVFGEVAPETAKIFAEVAEDEERHLKYCHAISKRYAPSEAEREKELARLRVLEAEAFRETQAENMRYIREHRLMPGLAPRILWRVIGAVTRPLKRLPLTTFARAAMPQLATARA